MCHRWVFKNAVSPYVKKVEHSVLNFALILYKMIKNSHTNCTYGMCMKCFIVLVVDYDGNCLHKMLHKSFSKDFSSSTWLWFLSSNLVFKEFYTFSVHFYQRRWGVIALKCCSLMLWICLWWAKQKSLEAQKFRIIFAGCFYLLIFCTF